jgi:hypothetical protein
MLEPTRVVPFIGQHCNGSLLALPTNIRLNRYKHFSLLQIRIHNDRKKVLQLRPLLECPFFYVMLVCFLFRVSKKKNKSLRKKFTFNFKGYYGRYDTKRNDIQHNGTQHKGFLRHSAQCHSIWSAVMLSVVYLGFYLLVY